MQQTSLQGFSISQNAWMLNNTKAMPDPLGKTSDIVSLSIAVAQAIGIVLNLRLMPIIQSIGWPLLTILTVFLVLFIVYLAGKVSNTFQKENKGLIWQVLMATSCVVLFGAPYIYKEPTDPRYWPREKWLAQPKTAIVGKHFRNEVVELDGKSFSDCEFLNVTLKFEGRAPCDIVHCNFNTPAFDFSTDPKMGVMLKLMQMTGVMDPNKVVILDHK